jgi:His-Xaa-Ser system protein HxsD
MAKKISSRASARRFPISARAKRAFARPGKKAVAKKSGASAGEVTFSLDVRKEGLEPILGAAYLLMDRAYAMIDGDKAKSLKVTLRPKAGRTAADLSALKRAFEDELAAQRLRWAVARNNQPVREYVAENALALSEEFAKRAAAPAAEPQSEQLTADQRSEIERLIAEVETEISQMNAKKDPAPKEAALSWEAAQESEKGGHAQ